MAQRRAQGGARRELSAYLTVRADDEQFDAWALNISRGGIRIIIEHVLELGQVVSIEGYDPDRPAAPPREARAVWVQEEQDGAIVGLQFLDADAGASVPPEPQQQEKSAETTEDDGDEDGQ